MPSIRARVRASNQKPGITEPSGVFMELSRSHFAAALLSVAVLMSGCADSTSPINGAIRATVTTTTAEIDRDPDGYNLRIDRGSPRAVDISGTVTFEGVGLGTHLVELAGLATNCEVIGTNPLYA